MKMFALKNNTACIEIFKKKYMWRVAKSSKSLVVFQAGVLTVQEEKAF